MSVRPYIVEVLGTPEAGKTTTIKEVISSLIHKGYNVKCIQESAEIVPSEFVKGSIDAHIWMRLHTAQSLLHASVSEAEIVIADRGIIDTLFWDYLYFLQGKISENQRNTVDNFFKSFGYMPDLVIIFTTSPEEAITRRGGEGRIVTRQFLEQYNSTLTVFCKNLTNVPKYEIDTTGKPVETVIDQFEQIILEHFRDNE